MSRGSGIYSGQTQRSVRGRFRDQQETLYTLVLEVAPGRYTVQLSVVDEIGKKFAFVRSAIVILERRSERPAAE